jgi:asparagine synthase (glutamine-hydrolysing)
MCGIAGIVTSDGTPPNEGVIRRMADAVAHRGPDGDGIWIRPGVGLGHRRLAIIDLSPAGSQPMSTQDGLFTIVYNGEVYNFQELREELVKLGSTFRSTSDTEVVLEAFRRWGKDCVKRLRGMFAFAIWDASQKRLFFARDRIGKKPLFYRILKNGSFAFASEIKSLVPLEPASIDECAVRQFLGLQYVPAPLSGFKEIINVPQGYRGFADAERVQMESYHDWNDISVRRSDDVIRDILDLLEESVRIRLVGDVPVGAFLSGGVDSAAVVALASRHTDRPLRTFTMGFPNIGMDERADAREIARTFHTDHQEFEAKPEDLVRVAEDVINQYDAPYADSSSIPLMLLAHETALQIKVVLTGDGGDELFGGYRRYVALERALGLSHIPGASRIGAPILRLASTVTHDPRLARMGETVRAFSIDSAHAYGELFCGSYFDSRRAGGLLAPEFASRMLSCDPIDLFEEKMGKDGKPLERAMRFDLTSYLPDDLNVKMDRATMAHGLEARSPFLDQNLAAYALGLPLSQKVNHGKTKIALKRALSGIVPESVIHRKKHGFQVPLADWFRGPLKDYWRERCLDPKGPLTDYIRLPAAKALYKENLAGADHGNRLWMLLAFSVWLGRFKPSASNHESGFLNHES